MGYPMKREIRIRLIFLFYEILCEFVCGSGRRWSHSCAWQSTKALTLVIPGMSTSFVEDRANDLISFLRWVT